MVGERAGPHSPVKLSGAIPPLAESFHQRPETGLDLRAGLYPGDTMVLLGPTRASTAYGGIEWRPIPHGSAAVFRTRHLAALAAELDAALAEA